jgi:hypothetical protein
LTPSVSPPPALPGDVPPNLKCGFCGQPVAGQFYRTINRFACGNCARQVENVIRRNEFAPGPFLLAAAAGLVMALVCGAVWAGVIFVSNVELGILASFIGVAVAKVALRASGNRRGVAMQVLTALLSVIGIGGGKIVLRIMFILKEGGVPISLAAVSRLLLEIIRQDPALLLQAFRGFDLLWIGIAVYAAWRICKAPPITIAGPYAYQPTAGGGIQFQTMEPAPRPPGTA